MKNTLFFISILTVLLITGTLLGRDFGPGYDQQIGSEVDFNNSKISVTDYATDAPETADIDNDEIVMKNPTFSEVMGFIIQDTTNRNKFEKNKYECRHFATDVNNNAETAGIRCAFVLICYHKGQHAVVGFDTTDKGMIYIEPQTDAAIRPITGGFYQGQEIVEILTSW
jgi:hypothetical protein